MILISNNGRFIVDRWLVRAGIAGVVLICALAAYSMWQWRKLEGIEGRHVEAKADFRQAERVYLTERTRLVRFTDTLNISDTGQVKAFVRACTSAINACDTALFRARAAIATGDSVITHLKRGPFMEAYGAVLYDPVAQTPTARLGIAIKPRSRISPMAEAEQRFAPGESPRLNLGVRIRF